MIIACYAVWNEEKLLGQSVESIIGYVDKVVIVDGSCDAIMPSNDATIKIAEDLKHAHSNIEIKHAKAWRNEAEKREAYLIGKDHDVYFIIDADEILFCGAEWLRRIEHETLYPDEIVFNVVIWNQTFPNVLHPRIYRHPFSYFKPPVATVTIPLVIQHQKYKKVLEVG